MNKRLGKFILLSCAALAVCIALSILYNKIALSLLETPPSALHVSAVVVIAVIFAAAVILRFFVPMLQDGCDEDTENEASDSILNRILGWAAWLFLSLCLSALVAAPLANTTDYIGYGAVFAVLSSLCATIPCIFSAEKAAMNADTSSDENFSKSIAALNRVSVLSLLLSLIPAVGISSALSCMAFSTTMLREEKAPSKISIRALAIGLLSAFVCAALTTCFVYLLFVK